MKIRMNKVNGFYKLIYGQYKKFDNGYMFNYGGIDFVVDNWKRWTVTHLQSGAAVNIVGSTRKECMQNFIKCFPYPEMCKEVFGKIDMKAYIKKYGINPMYENMDENLQSDFFINYINMGKEYEF